MEVDRPWHVAFAVIERPADALVVMWLFESREPELQANGHAIADLLDDFPSERSVAEVLATRMREIDGDSWAYTDFYAPCRGGLQPTDDEVRSFVERCATVGVRLGYADGSLPSLPSRRPSASDG